jgi:hypothetical protein
VYADINGLKMFYEIVGTSDPVKVPVVLLHGAISATGTSFGPLPDLLAQTRHHPAVVRKAMLASVTYDKTGLHPEMFGRPESGESADAPGRDLRIPFEQEYRALAPDPGN